MLVRLDPVRGAPLEQPLIGARFEPTRVAIGRLSDSAELIGGDHFGARFPLLDVPQADSYQVRQGTLSKTDTPTSTSNPNTHARLAADWLLINRAARTIAVVRKHTALHRCRQQ